MPREQPKEIAKKKTKKKIHIYKFFLLVHVMIQSRLAPQKEVLVS